jgi:hypothetical protein
MQLITFDAQSVSVVTRTRSIKGRMYVPSGPAALPLEVPLPSQASRDLLLAHIWHIVDSLSALVARLLFEVLRTMPAS